MIESAFRDSASYRDEAGHVYHVNGRIFRTISDSAASDYRVLRDSGYLEDLQQRGMLIGSREVGGAEIPGVIAAHVVEHTKIPFISYPYEWSFSALKSAALLTLDLFLDALDHDAFLVDASAYNIQFVGSRPVFIDLLSLRRYEPGEYWRGQEQFAENFLAPLLLHAAFGVPHNGWFRGALEGVPASALNAMLPWRWKLRWAVLTNVVLPEMMRRRVSRLGSRFDAKAISLRKLPKSALVAMLKQLRGFVVGIEARGVGGIWADYETHHTYNPDELRLKKEIVTRFAGEHRPLVAWDMGCNNGLFAKVLLDAGAQSVVGFDSDCDAVDAAFHHATETKLNFLPLILDAANPSPNQGWAQAERQGLAGRRHADALIALAFVHHLAVARNVPLENVLDWLISLAPKGIVEFVPKSDPTVQKMLSLRKGATFPNYDQPAFEAAIARRGRIVARHPVSASGRMLYEYAAV